MGKLVLDTETSIFKNIRVYCAYIPSSSLYSRLRYSLTIGLAFIVYWGIVLFGYDTYVRYLSLSSFCSRFASGVSGTYDFDSRLYSSDA